MSNETIARPQLSPRVREIVERRRAEQFATQKWTPGCARCGETAPGPLDAVEARGWWRGHSCRG